jgi:N,N'-diacetyllegionaminate synthase
MKKIEIFGVNVTNFSRPFIIAEIAQAHEGSLGMAHAYIDAVANSGADAIKFQTHIASSESTLDEPFRIKFSQQDDTRYEYWKRMEFTPVQWKGLKDHASECGLVFLSSAFSADAVEVLDQIDMPAWKVGSGEFWSKELILKMKETGKPLLISTGMSNWSEIDAIVTSMNEDKYPFALLQCTTKYPTAFCEIGINVLEIMQRKYDCPIGFSDHSGSVYPSMLAMAKGAALIEVHVTFHRGMFGPDVKASVTMNELAQIVEARDAFSVICENPLDKDIESTGLSKTRALFVKSLSVKKDLPIGHVITNDDLCLKKPGTGIQPEETSDVIGKILVKSVSSKRLLKWDDFA